MTKLFPLLFLGILVSCSIEIKDSNDSDEPVVHGDDSEFKCSVQAGIEAVHEKFGGECQISEAEIEVDEQTELVIWIDLLDNPVGEEFSNNLYVPLAQASYLVYNSLDQCDEYYGIVCAIGPEDEPTKEDLYTMEQFQTVKEFEPIFHQFTSFLKSENIDSAAEMFYGDEDKESIKDNLKVVLPKFNEQFGEIIESEFQGFKLESYVSNERRVVVLSGQLIRTEVNTAIFVEVDRETKKILKYDYSY